MRREFRGRDLGEVVRATLEEQPSRLERKGSETAQIWAPPFVWGPWTDVFVQFGVVGPDREDHVTVVNVAFDTASQAPSTFDIEIRGGDAFISSSGPGSETVTITGNVAATISVRCSSHSIGQNVWVTADW